MPANSLTSYHFPSFSKRILSEEEPTCICTAPSTGRRCGNRILQAERDESKTLRHAVYNAAGSASFEDHLREYLGLSLCKRYHRLPIQNDPVLFYQVCCKFEQEIIEEKAKAKISNSKITKPAKASSHAVGVKIREIGTRQSQRPHDTGDELSEFSDDSIESYLTSRTKSLSAVSANIKKQPLRTITTNPFDNSTQAVDIINSRKSDSSCITEIQSVCSNNPISVGLLVEDFLSPKAQRVGYISIYSHPKFPNLLKTEVSRMYVCARFARHCSNMPKFEYCSFDILYASLVERLLHAQLKQCRRIETCQVRSKCTFQRDEWYNIDINSLKEAMLDWVSLLEKSRPYDSEGFPKSEWLEVVKRFDTAKEEICPKKLLSALRVNHISHPNSIEPMLIDTPPVETEPPKQQPTPTTESRSTQIDDHLLQSPSTPPQTPQRQTTAEETTPALTQQSPDTVTSIGPVTPSPAPSRPIVNLVVQDNSPSRCDVYHNGISENLSAMASKIELIAKQVEDLKPQQRQKRPTLMSTIRRLSSNLLRRNKIPGDAAAQPFGIPLGTMSTASVAVAA